jgi:DNA-binding transcriptional ArsR family regulator
VHAFEVLGDPVRRRILELLSDGELTAGLIGATMRAEFGITQPAVSQHLKVLRDSGFASARADGPRRLYAVESRPLPRRRRMAGRFPPILGVTFGGAGHGDCPRQEGAQNPTDRTTA